MISKRDVLGIIITFNIIMAFLGHFAHAILIRNLSVIFALFFWAVIVVVTIHSKIKIIKMVKKEEQRYGKLHFEEA